VTAGNASSINDGAAAVVVAARETAEKLGRKPLCRIVGQAQGAQAPEWFTTAPAIAVQNLFRKIGWTRNDVDLAQNVPDAEGARCRCDY
jgi:acetyl-CoA C-acetyltransferase